LDSLWPDTNHLTKEQPDPNELDPPPPYSPAEFSGPSESPAGIEPSAPTASDIDIERSDIQPLNQNRRREPYNQAVDQSRNNYGSIVRPTTTGDADIQQRAQENLIGAQTNQMHAQANQQRAEGYRFKAMRNQFRAQVGKYLFSQGSLSLSLFIMTL
jgi:hypothetical protein